MSFIEVSQGRNRFSKGKNLRQTRLIKEKDRKTKYGAE
jgi:hypothetical protein